MADSFGFYFKLKLFPYSTEQDSDITGTHIFQNCCNMLEHCNVAIFLDFSAIHTVGIICTMLQNCHNVAAILMECSTFLNVSIKYEHS